MTLVVCTDSLVDDLSQLTLLLRLGHEGVESVSESDNGLGDIGGTMVGGYVDEGEEGNRCSSIFGNVVVVGVTGPFECRLDREDVRDGKPVRFEL